MKHELVSETKSPSASRPCITVKWPTVRKKITADQKKLNKLR